MIIPRFWQLFHGVSKIKSYVCLKEVILNLIFSLKVVNIKVNSNIIHEHCRLSNIDCDCYIYLKEKWCLFAIAYGQYMLINYRLCTIQEVFLKFIRINWIRVTLLAYWIKILHLKRHLCFKIKLQIKKIRMKEL